METVKNFLSWQMKNLLHKCVLCGKQLTKHEFVTYFSADEFVEENHFCKICYNKLEKLLEYGHPFLTFFSTEFEKWGPSKGGRTIALEILAKNPWWLFLLA